MAPLDRSHTSSYWCSIVTTARSCIISDNLVENCDFSHTPAAFDPVLWTSPLEYCRKVWYGKTRMVWLPDGEKFDNTLSSFDIIPVPICDRQDILPQHSPRYAYALRGKNWTSLTSSYQHSPSTQLPNHAVMETGSTYPHRASCSTWLILWNHAALQQSLQGDSMQAQLTEVFADFRQLCTET